MWIEISASHPIGFQPETAVSTKGGSVSIVQTTRSRVGGNALKERRSMSAVGIEEIMGERIRPYLKIMKSVITLLVVAIPYSIMAYVVLPIVGVDLNAVIKDAWMPVLVAAVNVLSSSALYIEADDRVRAHKNLNCSLDPVYWALVGLLLGVFGVFLFWIINDGLTARLGDKKPRSDE